MELEWTTILILLLQAVLAGFIGLGVWLFKDMRLKVAKVEETTTDTNKTISEFKLEVFKEFVPRDEYRREMDQVQTKLRLVDEGIDRMERKQDRIELLLGQVCGVKGDR